MRAVAWLAAFASLAAVSASAAPGSVRVLVDGAEEVAIRRVILPEITSEVLEFSIIHGFQTRIRFVPGEASVGPTTLVRTPLKGGDWQGWMRTVTDGAARRGSLDLTVRDALGADLQAWAIRDAFPSAWRLQPAHPPAVGFEEVLVVHGTLASLDDVPRIVSVVPGLGGTLQVTFQSEPGRRYRLQGAAVLLPTGTAWTDLGPEVVATGGETVLTTSAPAPGSPVFLRVVLLPPAVW